MKKQILLGLWVLTLILILPGAAIGKLYQYADQDGGVHFTDRPEEVPAQYQDQVKPVEKEITVEKRPNWIRDLLEKEEITWGDFVVFDEQGSGIGLKQKKLFWETMKKSRFIIWLSVELGLLILAVILLLSFRNWPTRRGRRNSAISIICGYLALAPAILFIFFFPSARNFLNLSQVYLTEIQSSARLDRATAEKIKTLDQKLQSCQDKLP